jgi:hypothetical protein
VSPQAFQQCCSVADPDPGSGAFLPLDPGSGSDIRDGEKSGSVSGMNIPNNFSESLQTVLGLKILKFFDANPESFWPWIRDGKIRTGINIPDPQYCSAVKYLSILLLKMSQTGVIIKTTVPSKYDDRIEMMIQRFLRAVIF